MLCRLASAAEITWNAFETATAFGATMPLTMVVVVIAFSSTDEELEVDCSVRAASVVVVEEVLLDVEVDDVVDEDVVDEDVVDELDVDVSATNVVLVVEVVDVVDVVEVVDVVVDVVVVVSGVADAASEARLRPFTFSAFTVMA